MIHGSRHSFDRLTGEIARRIDAAFGKIPKAWIEMSLTVFAALAVFWLIDKNVYYGLGAVVFFFTLLFVLTRPIILVYTAFAFIPIVWVNLLGRRFRVITFLTLLSLAYYVLRLIARKSSLPREPVFYAYLGYIGACMLSLINTHSVFISLTSSKYFYLSIMFGFALVLAVERKSQLKVLIWTLLIWGAALSVISILQSTVSEKFFPAYHFRVFGLQIVEQYAVQGIRRASGTFENGPRYAMFLLGPIAFSLVALYRNLDGRRLFWIGLLLLLGLGLMVSFTRAAITLGGMYIFLYNAIERNWRALGKSAAWALIVLVVASAVLFLFVPASVTDAAAARFDTEGGDPYVDRFTFMYNALGAWSENPIIGLGVGTYTFHSWDMMQKYPVPWQKFAWKINPLAMPQKVPVHNDYARMLAETGIFSLVSIVLVFVFSFRNYFYVIRNSKDDFLVTCAIAFAMYLGVMIPYWFVHEYIMMEAYTSMIPTILSILLKNIAKKEQNEERLNEEEGVYQNA